MNKKYTRKVSFNERSFLITDRLSPPTLNQFIFEGSGEFIFDDWKRALRESSAVNPGTRVTMKGFLSFSRWVETDIEPVLRIIDGSQWDGRSSENASFLDSGLSPFNGPVCEIVLATGDPLRVIFRSHHAVMDGRGTFSWIGDVFASLQKRKLLGAESSLTDEALMRSFEAGRRKPAPYIYKSPTGPAHRGIKGSRWLRTTVPGWQPDLLGRVVCAAADIARENGASESRFAIPVDLRSRVDGLRSTGNLTNTIYIIVNKNSTPESVTEDIKKQKAALLDCCFYEGDKIVNYIPISIMSAMSSVFARRSHRRNQYPNSGIISNMGVLPLDQFSGGGFQAEHWYGIPAPLEFIPFFMGLAGNPDSFDIITGMPCSLAGTDRLERFNERLAGYFSN